jgi:O-antigen/teichoic acid export membrane protein
MDNSFVKKSISQKIVHNTLFNIFGRIWSTVIVLLLTPYIINHIGVERYGIWAIVGVLTSYCGLLDFGISTSFIKYIAEFYSNRDYDKINQVVNTGFICYSVFAVLIIGLAFLAINQLLHLFNISLSLQNEARTVLVLGIIIFGINGIFSPFTSIQSSLQRMDITNKVLIAISIPQVIGTVLFLELGYGLIGLMVNNAIIVGLTNIVNLIIAFKILPQLHFSPARLSRKEMLRKLFGLGYKIRITTIAGWIQGQMDKIFLAYFLNVSAVTYYSVSSNLASRLKEMPVLLTSAILPAATELDTKTDKEQLYALYYRAMKYTFLVGFLVLFGVILLANPFIYLWLGKGFEKSALTLQILMLGFFMNLITAPGYQILNGMGKPNYAMISAIIAAVLNLILNLILVIKIGYFGVVIGTTISLSISAIYFLFMANQMLKLSILDLARKILVTPIIACVIPFLIVYLLMLQIQQMKWGILFGLGLLYLILTVVFILASNFFDKFDKVTINKYAPIRLFKVAD